MITAESVPAVLIDSVHFVENAETMYRATPLGPVIALSETEMAGFLRDFDRPRHIAKLWEYYVGRGRAGTVSDKGLRGLRGRLAEAEQSPRWHGVARLCDGTGWFEDRLRAHGSVLDAIRGDANPAGWFARPIRVADQWPL